MTMLNDDLMEADVLHAAATLITAFDATDTRAYFDSFTEDASFVFHTEASRLDTRADYEQVWAGWLAEGWRVAECSSSNQRVQLLGASALFVHDVRTTTMTDGVATTTHERETIVFQRTGNGVKAVHEHLSPIPTSPEASAP